MKKLLIITMLVASYFISSAQMLYLQDNFIGGISVDGRSYFGFDGYQADTIPFHNIALAGSTIRKAFLISTHYRYAIYHDTKDNNLPIIFNGTSLSIDSSNIVSTYHNCGGVNNIDVIVKDVSSYTLLNNNKLIIPNQTVLMINDTSRHCVYDGFLLVVLYENNTMPTTNACVFLNSGYHPNPTTYSFTGINPVNTINDAGISIWVNDIGPLSDSLGFTATSSLGSSYLGAIYPLVAYGNESTLPGSFYYQNNTLFGLVDDINSPYLHSTDAIANIKSYLPNNANNFTLTTNNSITCLVNNFVLAYTTPCPARSNKDTTISYSPICSGGSVQLNGTSTGTYTWSAPSNSLNHYNVPNPIANPTVTSTYIALVDSNGCKHTEQYKVNVYTTPKTDSVTTTTAVCGGTAGTATIVASIGSPTSYTVNGTVYHSPVISSLGVGTYTFALSNNFGCSYTSPKSFTIKDTNLAKAAFYITPTSGCEPLSIYCTNMSNYLGNVTNAQVWYVNGDSATTQNLNYTFTDTGTHIITLLAYQTLRTCSATATQTVFVKYCPPDSIHITVPNVFTPNGDNINDAWQLIIYNYNYTISNYQCTIYDRWGIKVFSSTNTNEAWSGKTTSGEACSEGAYFYTFKLTAANSKGTAEQKEFKGFLELVK